MSGILDMHKAFLGDESRIEKLEAALKRLYEKAHAVSKAVEGAIVMDSIQGHDYTGPTFLENFLEVEQLLGIKPERAPGVPIGHET